MDAVAVDEDLKLYLLVLEKANFEFKHYQYEGIKWCLKNERRKKPIDDIRGGFIADEMGLGKTITMLGTMILNRLQRTLIVVPTILISQWESQICRLTDHKTMIYHGNNKKLLKQEHINKAPIVITTYHTLASPNCLLKNLVWDRIIFDEAHHLRNCHTKQFEACSEIKAPIRWVVTGTPIQNKPADFQNLCAIAGMSTKFYKDRANWKTIGKHFVLKRTKEQVGLRLPDLAVHECMTDWKNKQEKDIVEEMHSLLSNTTRVSEAKCRQFGNAFDYVYKYSLIKLLKAKQCCISPLLMKSNVKLLTELPGVQVNPKYLQAVEYTSKLDLVTEYVLERKNNGNGKLIFCHFKTEIDLIRDKLIAGGIYNIVTYDGRNSKDVSLNELYNVDVLIIQIQTGCEGLNLQDRFSEVYFVSPNWNPFIEAQAIARCHRFGQTKQVEVFRFIMNGFDNTDAITLDQYIQKIQQNKQKISDDLFKILQEGQEEQEQEDLIRL